MRRLVVPLLVGLIVGLTATPAFGQFSDADTIGFIDTVRALPGELVEVPIYLSTDETVSGVNFIFRFDHQVLQPVIEFQQNYANIPVEDRPDSAEYQLTPAFDPGLWSIDYRLTDTVSATWNPDWGYPTIFYNLNKRDTARLFMAPNPIDTSNPPSGYVRPSIPGEQGPGGGGITLAYVKFRVNADAVLGTMSPLVAMAAIPYESQQTELALDVEVSGTIETQSVIPRLRYTAFVVDTADTGTTPQPTDENEPPVLATITPNVYNIKQGELVSFTVSATDIELGEVRITANGGNITTPNAALAPSNPIIGANGVATGTFSFKPDISQQGTFAFTFQALDDSGAVSAAQVVSVVVEELEIDLLYTSSAPGIEPEGGVPGLNEVMVPINMVSKKTIYGVQYDLTYNHYNFKLDSIVLSDRIPGWVVYDNIGVEPGSLRVVTFGLSNDPMEAGSNSAIMYLAFTVDEFAQYKAGGYPLEIFNGRESIDPDPNIPSLELVTEPGVLYVDLWGNVNLDENGVDVADLVSVVAYIIRNYDLTRRQFAAADIVANDTVNVVDLVGIINTIFGVFEAPGAAPAQAPELADQFAALTIVHDEIPSSGMEAEMEVLASMPTEVAGVELEIQYDPAYIKMLAPLVTDASQEFEIRSNDDGTGMMKVVIYSMKPWDSERLIQEGLSDIIKLPFVSLSPISGDDDSRVKITRAYVSTGAAKNVAVEGMSPGPLPNRFELYQNWPNPFNPSTNIRFYIDGSAGSSTDHVRLDVFNILGQMVKTIVDKPLPAGEHIYTWDGTDNDGIRMASGVYLYRLKVGDEGRTRKMVLLK